MLIKNIRLYFLVLCMVFTLLACTNTETIKSDIENSSQGNYEVDSEIYTADNKQIFVQIKYPVIKNMNDKIKENSLNSIILLRVEEYMNLYYKDEESKQNINVDYNITKKSENYLSMNFHISIFVDMAAHPSNLLDAVTFDLRTGRELQLEDLFLAGTDYKTKLNTILLEKVNELDFELLEEYKGIEKGQKFYLTDVGLVLFHQPYQYTPHAYGPLKLEIPFKDIKEIIE